MRPIIPKTIASAMYAERFINAIVGNTPLVITSPHIITESAKQRALAITGKNEPSPLNFDVINPESAPEIRSAVTEKIPTRLRGFLNIASIREETKHSSKKDESERQKPNRIADALVLFLL